MFIPTEAFGQSWPDIGDVVIVADDASLEGTIGLIEAAEVGRVVDGRIDPSAGHTVDSAAPYISHTTPKCEKMSPPKMYRK